MTSEMTPDMFDRVEAVLRVSSLRKIAEDLDVEILQANLGRAFERVPHDLTRNILLDCINYQGISVTSDRSVLQFIPPIDPEDDEASLLFTSLVLEDLVSDTGPGRYGNAARLVTDAITLWVIPSLAEGLGESFDSAAQWRMEYELDPEGDSIADIAGCLEAEMGRGLSAYSHIEIMEQPNGTYSTKPTKFSKSIWVYWETVLKWLMKQKVSHEDLATWLLENGEFQHTMGICAVPGITTFSYAPQELQEQVDWNTIVDWAETLCSGLDSDIVKMALYSNWFEMKECCINEIDLAGKYPCISSYIDCGYDQLSLVYDFETIERFWKEWCEEKERETGGLLVDMEISGDQEIY